MKTILNKLLALSLISLIVLSCKKDETLIKVQDGIAPVLTSPATNLVLTEATEKNPVLPLTWEAADFGYNAAVTYTLQFAKAGTDFASPRNEVVNAGLLQKIYNVADFNSLVQLAGLEPGESSDVEIRVKATINDEIEPIYSNVISLTVKPYEVIIVYPTMYVPGAHQADPEIEGNKVKGFYSNPDGDGGWNPGTAPSVMSLEDNDIYQGYVYFPSATNEFKVTPGKSWTDDYEGANTNVDEDGNNYGTLGGSDNMKVFGAGYYLLEVNLNNNTYTASPREWGVIGSATPTFWDSDTNMTYDPISGTLKITMDLEVGAIKFRANDDWDISYGDKTGDKVLDTLGGNDIPVTEEGTYLIEMDLRNLGKLKYSLTKQ